MFVCVCVCVCVALKDCPLNLLFRFAFVVWPQVFCTFEEFPNDPMKMKETDTGKVSARVFVSSCQRTSLNLGCSSLPL